MPPLPQPPILVDPGHARIGRGTVSGYTLRRNSPAILEGQSKSAEVRIHWDDCSSMRLGGSRSDGNYRDYTVTIAGNVQPIASELHDKHFLRKHGHGAYYGQVQVKDK